MSADFRKLNEQRSADYRKDPAQEDFFAAINAHLQPFDRDRYVDEAPSHPFVFVLGAPRSGTTLMSQLIAYCLDVGYVNNLAARFWLAPVSGLKLSQAVLAQEGTPPFASHFGATTPPTGIHEFGYFWRHWLKKKTFEDVRDAVELEETIDWSRLRMTLASMQAVFQRPMAFKNILGTYHMNRLTAELGEVLWVYIRRDPLDACISTLGARRRHYDDPRRWWSYIPPTYESLIDQDEYGQVAGQIQHLHRFYQAQLDALPDPKCALQFDYADVCADPETVVTAIQTRLREQFSCKVDLRQAPPQTLPLKTYDRDTADAQAFLPLLEQA